LFSEFLAVRGREAIFGGIPGRLFLIFLCRLAPAPAGEILGGISRELFSIFDSIPSSAFRWGKLLENRPHSPGRFGRNTSVD
jgi:hypothetical protein